MVTTYKKFIECTQKEVRSQSKHVTKKNQLNTKGVRNREMKDKKAIGHTEYK